MPVTPNAGWLPIFALNDTIEAISDLPARPPERLAPPPWPAAPPPHRRQWPIFAFLIVALLATLGVAIVGWFRPLPGNPPPPPTYTAKQVADAKAQVCAAHEKVHS